MLSFTLTESSLSSTYTSVAQGTLTYLVTPQVVCSWQSSEVKKKKKKRKSAFHMKTVASLDTNPREILWSPWEVTCRWRWGRWGFWQIFWGNLLHFAPFSNLPHDKKKITMNHFACFSDTIAKMNWLTCRFSSILPNMLFICFQELYL